MIIKNEDQILETDADNIEDYTSDDGGIYPYSKDVDLTQIEINLRDEKISVFEVLRWTRKGKFVLDPEFQRSPNAWKEDKKSMFIESLILNLPLPHFYLNKDISGKYIVIDGLQRLTAILDFFDGKFKLSGLKALPWLNGKDYKELNETQEEIVGKIEDKNIPYYSIMPNVPMAVTYDIFRRINTGGTSLERQEIRNCIYLGKSTSLLKKLADSDEFKKSIDNGISAKRMKDREAVLRCIAFSDSDFMDRYTSDMDDFLGNKMKEINRLNLEDVDEIGSEFIRVMTLIEMVFGDSAFRIKNKDSRGPINMAVMDSVYNFFYNEDESYILSNKNSIAKSYDEMIKDPSYINAVKTSTNSRKKVSTRMKLVKLYLGSYHAD
ncbi:hypothetical protein SN11_02615 [Vibrio harveyi]|nr:hypothetical protein SN11_02615 [Vibrio harveyi]